MLGARVFEKHFTLDRSWKGTDHAFFIRTSRFEQNDKKFKRIPLMIGSKNKNFLNQEKKPLLKMQKSIYAKIDLKKGTKLSTEHLTLKSPGGGFKPYELYKLVNKTLRRDIYKEEMIKNIHFKK